MAKRSAKTDKILDVALEILRVEGDFGVTMRKVANNADMSLSNVQYYFKNKDVLLMAMVDRYIQQCLDELKEFSAVEREEELKPLLSMLLSHVYEVSDMCRVFREYWAISTRNEAIENHILDYYRSMLDVMAENLRPIALNDDCLKQALSILIPFVEGYSITARALPNGLVPTVDVLENVLLQSLNGKITG
ncbi:TetR/AcrR family transcriptional regulator [Vibrio sp. D404a]|uniref:TetR/AcrR family transcriptional regulator n=1 Tax=unclassified Vibrio TaxID=2614977 RepID=UPI002552B2A2|nr:MULTISPECIES: TetR/AcrR family transcriptional regulator [unclassified Vibrio]MDK9735995.1 TetR/AcrR family transcriptional regulator [Vibrio sp. D404a]MDK9797839.1 TetR/AcrR family transcriptional regulator [Vibrio sp. D449a]